MTSEIKSRNPEARRIPTAAMRPISVGIRRITVRNRSLAPLIKGLIYIYALQYSVDNNAQYDKGNEIIGNIDQDMHINPRENFCSLYLYALFRWNIAADYNIRCSNTDSREFLCFI